MGAYMPTCDEERPPCAAPAPAPPAPPPPPRPPRHRPDPASGHRRGRGRPIGAHVRARGLGPAASAPGGNAAILGIDYATWQRDVADVIDAARPAIEQRIAASPAGEKPALVLDIDNSSLETDFHWFWTFPTPAIGKVRDLTRYANERGVAVFFVTARPGIVYSLTERNLKAVGYPVSGLYVRDLPDLFHEVSTYKTGKRAEIEAAATRSSPTSGTTRATSSAATPNAP